MLPEGNEPDENISKTITSSPVIITEESGLLLRIQSLQKLEWS